jgi:hypothetical protein
MEDTEIPGNVQSDQEGMQENLEKIQEDLGMEDPIKGNLKRNIEKCKLGDPEKLQEDLWQIQKHLWNIQGNPGKVQNDLGKFREI